MVYDPGDDSYLLQKWVRRYSQGHVLDIGTGTGVQALAAAEKAVKVVALDIDGKAVSLLKVKHPEIECHQSDLFSYYKKRPKRFDTIIFNPPYLPTDKRVKDKALDGGKKGYEILDRFLKQLPSHLYFGGCALVVFSSLTGRNRIDEAISNNLLRYELLEKKRIFFEDLYVYLVRRSRLLERLEDRGVTSIEYFTRGKRGVLYTARYRGKKVVIKTKRPDSKAVGRIENESRWLRLLNRQGIGPRLLFSHRSYVVYEFVEGTFIVEHFQESSKQRILQTIREMLRQLHVMDRLRVDKEEMHHPLKHIIVGRKPVLIDFERCHDTDKPKNVTQFLMFLGGTKVKALLRRKGFRLTRQQLIDTARSYKKSYDFSVVERLLGEHA